MCRIKRVHAPREISRCLPFLLRARGNNVISQIYCVLISRFSARRVVLKMHAREEECIAINEPGVHGEKCSLEKRDIGVAAETAKNNV